MPLLADDHADRGRAVQAALLHVPARVAQHVVARGGERREVRHLAARDEAEGGVPRETEQLEQPVARDLLDDRRGRAADVQAGVLVPGRGQPVRGERGRDGAADHETEVASRRLGDDAGVGGGRQLRDHRARIGRLRRERRGERLAQLGRRHARVHRTLGERLVEVPGEAGRQVEELTQLVHAPSLDPPLPVPNLVRRVCEPGCRLSDAPGLVRGGEAVDGGGPLRHEEGARELADDFVALVDPAGAHRDDPVLGP